jgi:DHA2 family methylenomycin A resistance protein-like MFS transporter
MTRLMTLSPRLQQRGFDIPGQVAGIVTLGTLTFAFNEGGHIGWQMWPIWGVLATAILLFIERRTSSPMLPLELFSSSTFSAANVVGLLLNFGFYGQLFFINLFFQQVKGYSPLLTGLALLPETGMVWLGNWLSGRVTARTGPRLPMVIGPLIGATGFFSMCLADASTPYLVYCLMLMAIGFGMALNMPAMTNACIESAPRERSSIASAVLNAGRQRAGCSLTRYARWQPRQLCAGNARCPGYCRRYVFGRMRAVVLRDPRDQRVCPCDSRKLTERNSGSESRKPTHLMRCVSGM